MQIADARPFRPFRPVEKISFAAVALAAGGALGVASGLGLPNSYLVAGLVAPFLLLVTLARPTWIATLYVMLVYGDLLSILTRFHNFPPLARFAGALIFGAVLGYRLLIRRRPVVLDELTWWLLGYALVLALGLFYARDTSLVGDSLVEFARNFLTFLIITNTATTAVRLRRMLWAMLALGTLLALLTIFQQLTHQYDNDFGGLAQYRVSEITGVADAARPGGTIGDANYYGQFLLIVLPLALYLVLEGRSLTARLLGLTAAGSLTLAIIFTYSRGDALALLALFGAAMLYKRLRPIYLVGIALAGLVILPFLPPSYLDRLTTVVSTVQGNQQAILSELSIRGRAGAQQAAIEIFLDHPLLGVGRENYPLYQPEYLAGTNLAFSSKGIPPHDLYLEIAAENGLAGLLVVGGLLALTGRAIVEAWRGFRRQGDRPQAELAAWLGIGLIGYLVSSFFLHGAFLYMLWLQVALICALRQIARATPSTPAPAVDTTP